MKDHNWAREIYIRLDSGFPQDRKIEKKSEFFGILKRLGILFVGRERSGKLYTYKPGNSQVYLWVIKQELQELSQLMCCHS